MPVHALIFTDLDGTLLNTDDYRCDAALPLLQNLHNQNIPVIPVTSKTRAEVEQIRQQIAPQDPFIVENGSGIFKAAPDPRFPHTAWDDRGTLQQIQLGCSYLEARRGLYQLSEQIGFILQGFGDLSVEDIHELTGLPLEEAARAKYREFTEPFLTPKDIAPAILTSIAQDHPFQIVIGDRFSHLIGKNAGKGVAVQYLIHAYRTHHPEQDVITIGLGNSPNDRPMLEAVDIAVIIPGQNGPHPELFQSDWILASAPGAAGWMQAVATLLSQISS